MPSFGGYLPGPVRTAKSCSDTTFVPCTNHDQDCDGSRSAKASSFVRRSASIAIGESKKKRAFVKRNDHGNLSRFLATPFAAGGFRSGRLATSASATTPTPDS